MTYNTPSILSNHLFLLRKKRKNAHDILSQEMFKDPEILNNLFYKKI